MNKALKERAQQIKLLAMDVDGVLTDGSLFFSSEGDTLKAFNSQDGHGLKMLKSTGVSIAIITGRTSDIVARRANELGIDILMQGREDKLTALNEVATKLDLRIEQAAYIGDDLPDLSAIQAAGIGFAVANAANGIGERADYVTQARGGKGAVREACEWLLEAQGKWQSVVAQYCLADASDGKDHAP
ncbi:MAG: KdsC family phosphatase [Pseudomonadales bacterium]